MDLETTGANPAPSAGTGSIGGGDAPRPGGKPEVGHVLILAFAACWVAAGLFVAPLATLAWLVCVGGIAGTAAWLANRMDDRIYRRVASGHCAQCGYDLQGSGPRGECPECGAWFGPGWGAAIAKGKAADGEDAAKAERESELLARQELVE